MYVCMCVYYNGMYNEYIVCIQIVYNVLCIHISHLLYHACDTLYTHIYIHIQRLSGSDLMPEKVSLQPVIIERRASKGLNSLTQAISAFYNTHNSSTTTTAATANSSDSNSRSNVKGQVTTTSIPPLNLSSTTGHNSDLPSQTQPSNTNDKLSNDTYTNNNDSNNNKHNNSTNRNSDGNDENISPNTSTLTLTSTHNNTLLRDMYNNTSTNNTNNAELRLKLDVYKQLTAAQTRVRYLEFILFRDGGGKKGASATIADGAAATTTTSI